MKKFAVIDVGSNSVRLLVVADGKTLYKRLKTTRLGEGIATSPRLLPVAIERTAQAVKEFYEGAKKEGAEGVFSFATAAVRSAENGMEFVERVRALCPLRVEVVSGEKEAEIGLLGALGNKDGGVIDIGGASTEIVVKKAGSILYKKSVNVGVVRLKDICGRDVVAMQSVANNLVKEFEGVPIGLPFYGIGGTATTLAAQYLKLQKYDSKRVTGTCISAKETDKLAAELSAMTVEEIAALPAMLAGRADVITGGAIWLNALMNGLNIDKITVSDRDNLEGYAISLRLME